MKDKYNNEINIGDTVIDYKNKVYGKVIDSRLSLKLQPKDLDSEFLDTLDLSQLEVIKDNWISVNDRLPEIKEYDNFSGVVIVSDGEKVTDNVALIMKDNGEYYFKYHHFGYDYDSYIVNNVTHWQPLPSLPKSK